MKLKWIEPESLGKNLKATVHKSGKLGFTMVAAEKLKLDRSTSIKIAIDEENPNDKDLYVAIFGSPQKGAFKVGKAGKYFYVNTKALFDSLKVDYKGKDSVAYDIIKEREIDSDMVIYRFKRRENTKKKTAPNEAVLK